jgi:hypothetical protein
MSRRIDEAIWVERRAWIERQAGSGLSAARFCREHGLKLSNFHAWKRKFAGAEAVIHRRRAGPAGQAAPRSSNTFVQVPVQLDARVAGGASWIEIVSASGMVVRVPAANLSALQVVLAALGPARETTDA